MPEVTVRQLFEAGVHFGHRPCFWNPKLAPYIYGEHNGVHIIDLDKTLPLLKEALNFVSSLAANGGTILFVGTKKAASRTIRENAERCDMPYVDHHWLGGALTNFKTVRRSIIRYGEMKALVENGKLESLRKKEAQRVRRKLQKLSRSFEGIRNLERMPDAMFIVDVGYEEIAVKEAAKLGIPVVAIVDTNGSTDHVDYVVPANDDAIRSVQLYATLVADTILESVDEAKKKTQDDSPYVEVASDEAF